jgi:prolyl oligopeptidase
MTRLALPLVLLYGLASAACSGSGTPEALSSPPPVTRTEALTETIHGGQVVDPYRWLEADSPEVRTWTQAQNRYARAVLDTLPGRQATESRLVPLIQVSSVTAPVMRGNRYFYGRRPADHGRPAIFVRDGALGSERLLIDPSKPVAADLTEVAWFSPSPDGRLLAIGADETGAGVGTLRVIKVDDGSLLPDRIPVALEGAQWLADSTGFLYDALVGDRISPLRQGALHILGASSGDAPLYRQPPRPPGAPVDLSTGPSATLSRDGKWLLLSYWIDSQRNDLWLAPLDAFRARGPRAAVPVTIGVPGTARGQVIDGTLYLHTTKGAPRGRVIAVPAASPAERDWVDIVPQGDEAIDAVAFGRGVIAVTYLRNASTAIEVFDAHGGSRGRVTLPGIGSASIEASEDRTEAYVTFASFNHPPTVFRVDLATPSAAPKYWSGPDLAFNPATVEISQAAFPSKDGTRITMFVVHKKGLARNGSAPTLLSGYGGLGVRVTPTFAAPFIPWFEAGGVLAVPNLRGGGEYGPGWHEAGRGEGKERSIADLVAAAEWLIANRYASPRSLALLGESHGGLVAAAAAIARPDLFRSVVLNGPPADMIRFEAFTKDRYWVEEYGSPSAAGPFGWLVRYSPYHRALKGGAYPAMLITAASAGGDVPGVHARKLAAALQAATTSPRASAPILLQIDDAPPSPESAVDLERRALVDQRVFLSWTLGMR